MYNLNELAFEAMLENLKHTSNGNPFAKLTIDSMSYEYNRQQYNDCLRHINEENNQIANIYNQISQRGGFITPQEQMELQRHIQLRGEYEVKKHETFHVWKQRCRKHSKQVLLIIENSCILS